MRRTNQKSKFKAQENAKTMKMEHSIGKKFFRRTKDIL